MQRLSNSLNPPKKQNALSVFPQHHLSSPNGFGLYRDLSSRSPTSATAVSRSSAWRAISRKLRLWRWAPGMGRVNRCITRYKSKMEFDVCLSPGKIMELWSKLDSEERGLFHPSKRLQNVFDSGPLTRKGPNGIRNWRINHGITASFSLVFVLFDPSGLL